MSKKVTIYDIAEKLNLSPSTVSRALANNSVINIHTRTKVRKAAEELGYPGTVDAGNNAGIVAAIVPEIGNFFYDRVLEAIQTALKGRYLLAVFCSYNSAKIETDIVSRMNPAQIKCLVISQSMDIRDCSHLTEAEKRGIPVILFNRVHYDGACPKFLVDNYMDSYILTRHLVSAGRRRIAFAAKHYNCPIYKDRIRAYKDVLAQNHIPFDPDLLIYSDLTLEDTQEVIYRFLKRSPRPDALILPNFSSALQAASLLKIHNLAIPKDIALVNFDQDPECKYSSPAFSGLERPATEIGNEIGQTILSICDEKNCGNPDLKIFSSTLIIRGSSFDC